MSETEAGELLEATRAFLRDEVLPQLEGFSAYNTRVAANNLAIVARELQLKPELDRLDLAIAGELGIDPGTGPVAQQLACRLRDRELALDDRLLEYLKHRTLKLLEIDNPRYSGYLQACERWGPEGAGAAEKAGSKSVE
jgi:hypothetical protein